MRKALLFSFLTCVSVAGAHAQTHDVTFGRIHLPGGANGNFVTSIVQDRQGFMWFGTWAGLHRYDGYQFTTFTHRPDDPGSLASARVEWLHLDRAGTLWVGTFGAGLDRFDAAAETFSHYRHDAADPNSLSDDVVTVILEDRAGALWVGTHGGLNRLDRRTGTFTRYRHDPADPASLSDDQVRALYEDRSGTLWVGTGSPSDPPEGLGGLNRLDPGGDGFTRFLHDPADPTTLADSQVRALYEDRAGTFWVGTWGDGLHSMDRAAGTFVRHVYDPDRPGGLSRPYARDAPGEGGVSFVHEDAAGVLWIGAVDGGLSRYDPSTALLTHYEHDPDDLGSLSDNRIWSVYESRDGTLWIGALGGLHKVDLAGSQIPHYVLGSAGTANNVRSLAEGRDGKLWLGTSRGLYTLDRETGAFERPAHVLDARAPHVLALLEDRDRVLWTGTRGGGLGRFDPATGAVTHYEHAADDPASLSGNTVTVLYEDRRGALWVGTEAAGLNRFDRAAETFTRYLHDGDDPNTLIQNTVEAVLEDREGRLWIGTRGGLTRFDPDAGSFARYAYDAAVPGSLSDNVVLSLCEDRRGRLWVGTESGGLNVLDRETGTFTLYDVDNSGLPDNRIQAILEGDRGDLWMSTGRGLTRFDPDRGTFHTFGADTGLPAEPFYAGSAYRSRSGELFFGGRDGFHAFLPERIRVEANERPPQVALTGFRLFGQAVRPRPDGPLRSAISRAREVVLTHRQNDLGFSFAALHFTHPEKNQYVYRLEPYDEAWHEAGFARNAAYTNLDPGTYVFHVRAASSAGVWNEAGASVRLVITPPFWETWWFRGLTLAAVVGLAFGTYRLRVRHLQAHNRRLEREVAERTRDLEHSLRLLTETQDQLVHAEKMVSLGELTMGVAHQMKNPLNFVNNFAELSVERLRELRAALDANGSMPVLELRGTLEEVLSDLAFSAERIREHGRRADGIVRSMMQHARGGSGEQQRTDVNALVDQYVELAFLGRRAQQRDFACELRRDYDEAVGEVALVPQEMGQVLINLLGNAFDAVQRRAAADGARPPVVHVSTRRADGMVEIRVRDNGPGVPEALRSKIFEPFFTTKPTGAGTGLGLSIAYEIVTQGHGGALHVEPAEDHGAVFVVTLPDRHAADRGRGGRRAST